MSLRIRVFASRGTYRREMGTGGLVGPFTIPQRGPTLGRALVWRGALGAPPQVPSGLRDLLDLLFMAEKISSDSENIFRVGFLKRKTAETGNWHGGILLIG